MIAIGPENFSAMLAGFHAMDEHFRRVPFERNLPALMGPLTIWYTNGPTTSWAAIADCEVQKTRKREAALRVARRCREWVAIFERAQPSHTSAA